MHPALFTSPFPFSSQPREAHLHQSPINMGDARELASSNDIQSVTSTEKPVLLFMTLNASGHTAGAAQIAKHLHFNRGYKDIYFIAGPSFQSTIENTGAKYIKNPFEFTTSKTQEGSTEGEEFFRQMKAVFGDSIVPSYHILKKTLEDIRITHPEPRQILFIHEALSQGLLPFYYGCPLPKGYTSLPRSLNWHTSIYLSSDPDYPPFGLGLRYDPTPENLALWKSMHEGGRAMWQVLIDYYDEKLRSIGSTKTFTEMPLDVAMEVGDVTVMATTPSLEYSNVTKNPKKFRLVGGLPVRELEQNLVCPPWWGELTSNSALGDSDPTKKRVVFVSQGTVHRAYHELLIPTIRAMADRDDMLVIATLGEKNEPSPLAEEDTPKNVRVVDYFPYEAVLPHSDVFVSNAGYGGFMHGVMNGVPMVLAGLIADKGDVCQRAARAGVAVNLATSNPTEEDIKRGVEAVLSDWKYKQRVREIQEENVKADALGQIEGIIEELLRGE
ncbi:family 1 putative glycosyltransferase [Triangularia setosa]|uniref:Family 1 putative glycosyltransferase n=1 Tax=Triangularia setosa TaxID=2587417 RepID=A0AAN6W626_9PEZI|nr:family 1 putative glycosyltransferase [Podospora setosa]